MIITNADLDSFELLKDQQITLDLGRPSYRVPAEFEAWTEFYNYAEYSHIRVRVNGIYNTMKENCANRVHYAGGGFSFVFWFLTEFDRDEFVDGANRIFDSYRERLRKEFEELRATYKSKE